MENGMTEIDMLADLPHWLHVPPFGSKSVPQTLKHGAGLAAKSAGSVVEKIPSLTVAFPVRII